MILHVANYNLTARFEYNTRGFTKVKQRNNEQKYGCMSASCAI
jgi:hypothetical protein